MNTYNYAIELAREIINTKEVKTADYFELTSKDNNFIQYTDDYIEIKAAQNTKALHVAIFKPLTSASSNPIIYVDDEGKCFRNHGERSSFCVYAELLLRKPRTVFFCDWAKEHEQQIVNLFIDRSKI